MRKAAANRWLSFVCAKKLGDLRMCIDYRELNKKKVKDAYPLPLADDLKDKLAGSTIFSTVDLWSRYWQMPVHHGEQYNSLLSRTRTKSLSVQTDALMLPALFRE